MANQKFEITDRVRLILKGCPVPIEDLPISFVERRVKEYDEWLARGIRERDAMGIHLVECSDMPGIYRDKDHKYPFFGDCQNCHRFAASSAVGKQPADHQVLPYVHRLREIHKLAGKG